MRRLAGIAAAAVLAAGTAVGAALAAGPAGADPIAQCTTSTGTIVAADFGHWSGPIVRGCGVHSASGYALLHDAGFTTAGTVHDGPAFICRIGNGAFNGGTQYPTTAEQACNVTPPASAYWSYWLAPKGQNTWSYSRLGATSDHPLPGEVELWKFGATNVAGTEGVPSVSPDSLRAHNASPPGGGAAPHPSAPRTTVPPAPPQPGGGGAPTSATRGSSGPSGPAHPTASGTVASSAARQVTRAATRTTSAPSGAAASTPPGSDAAHIVAAAASAPAKHASGSVVAAIVGIALVAALGGGTGWTLWRRRRAESADS